MELKGTVEIEETYYKRSLELAFTDYLEEDTRTPKLFRDCIIDRLIEDPEHRVRINQDDIRLMLGKYWVPKRELLVQHIQEEALIEALLKGYDIVIDNTNLNKKVLDNYRALVIAHGNHAIEFKDFFDTPLSVCIERDKNRDLQVTERVIRSFYNNYKDKYPLNGN